MNYLHQHFVLVTIRKNQVGSVKAAERAIAAGVDCIIAQGVEAGGHIAEVGFHRYWRCQPDYEQLQNDESQPVVGHSIIFTQDTVLRRFAGQAANRTTVGELDQMVMYAGQGVGLVNDIVPAAEVIKRFVDGAKAIIEGLGETHLPKTNDPPEMHGEETEAKKLCF